MAQQGWVDGPAPDTSAWTPGPAPAAPVAPTAAPEGDQLLANLKNIIGFPVQAAIGAGKELLTQGMRGGALLRKIPGVSRVSDAIMPPIPVNTTIAPDALGQQAGKMGLDVAEFMQGGKLAGAAPTLVTKAAAGGAINAGLASTQGSGPVGTTIAAGMGVLSPFISAALQQGATGTSTKIEASLVKGSARDYANGYRPENIAKYDVGGSLEQTYNKTTQAIQQAAGQLRDVLKNTATGDVDLGQVYTDTVARYQNNPQAADAADRILQHVEFALNKQGVPLGNGVVNLADANLAKQAVGDMGAWLSTPGGGMTSDADRVAEDVANTFYDQLKNGIEQNATGPVAKINRKIGDLIAIRSAVIRRIPVMARQNILKLSDMFGLASGRVPIGVLDRVLQSGNVAQGLAHAAPSVPGLVQTGSQLGAAGITQADQQP